MHSPLLECFSALHFPQWNQRNLVVLLFVQGTLGSRRSHSGGPASMTGLRTDTMAAHRKYRQVSWEDAPCLGCLPLLCMPQWVLAGLGLSRLFWGPVFTRSRAPVHILVLSCSLSWENLDCQVTFLHLKINGRGQVLSPSEKFQHLKIQALDHEGNTLILTSPHLQPSRNLERKFTCLFNEIQLR